MGLIYAWARTGVNKQVFTTFTFKHALVANGRKPITLNVQKLILGWQI